MQQRQSGGVISGIGKPDGLHGNDKCKYHAFIYAQTNQIYTCKGLYFTLNFHLSFKNMSPQINQKQSINPKAIVRQISQVSLSVSSDEHKSVDGKFKSIVKDALIWMQSRAGTYLPKEAFKLQSFELTSIGSQRCSGISLDNPQYWTARFDDADESVPMRTWTTEIGIGLDDVKQTVLIGVRLICITRGVDAPFVRSVPGFVKKIVDQNKTELDGLILPKHIKTIDKQADVNELISLLQNMFRQTDVLVFSLPKEGKKLFDTKKIAKKVFAATKGAVHVFMITPDASDILTNEIGRELSVYGQRVRTYRPEFNIWDQGSDHPFALPEKIAHWNDVGPDNFADWLINQSLGNVAYARDNEDHLPYFNTIRRIHAEQQRRNFKNSGASDADLLKLYQDDNNQLRDEIQDQKNHYDSLLSEADCDLKQAKHELRSQKELAFERLQYIRLLEERLKSSECQITTDIPDNLTNFESWCKQNLLGSVELVSKAFQGVRKSNFHDPAFIYQSLLLLRDYYVPMRKNRTAESKTAYEQELAKMQLEESGTGDGIKYAADTYSAVYGGIKYGLDRHLKGSNSRDRQFGFRIYFFWHDENELVVVGWLPSHLDNRMS